MGFEPAPLGVRKDSIFSDEHIIRMEIRNVTT